MYIIYYIAIEEGHILFRILVTDKFVQLERNVIYTLNAMKIYHDSCIIYVYKNKYRSYVLRNNKIIT